MKTIKRYSNRKLYDTNQSRYVTLDEIATLIEDGEEVRIIDNKTEQDISRQTLAQIILKREKKQRSLTPVNALRELVQKGGDSIAEAVRRGVRPIRGFYAQVGGDLERPLKRLVERGLMTEEEGRRMIRRLLDRGERGRAGLEARVDARIAAGLERLNIPTAREVEKLGCKIDELIRRIDHLNAKGSGV